MAHARGVEIMKSQTIILAMVLLSMFSQGLAATMPEAVFIVDASGSMAAALGSESKMEAAKAVLAQTVAALDPDVKVGLAAYGHRRERDCEDIEVLVAPGHGDRAAVLAKIGEMRPVGMTPISEAILAVAEFLKTRDAETTIVLVSDGRETCGGDPCEVVWTLKKSGIRFVLHVVGFEVTEHDKEQLACMAKAGGGTYFGADGATALLAALQTVNEEIGTKVVAAKTQVVRRATGLGKVHLVLPESALKTMAGFRIVRVADDKTVKDAVFPSADSTHPLMSGTYQLIFKFANPN